MLKVLVEPRCAFSGDGWTDSNVDHPGMNAGQMYRILCYQNVEAKSIF